jgi:hypothetical protein
MDAMMDAIENGGDRRSLFPDGTGDQKSNTRTRVTVVGEENSTTTWSTRGIEKKEEEEKIRCVQVRPAPCVFFEQRRTTREYDDAEYGLTTSVEPIPSNNIRRKSSIVN